jgi:hypothetical protein
MHTDLRSYGEQAGSEQSGVIAAVSRGLHDMAQPLTMLMGLLELALGRPETASELRMTMELSLDQAGRAVCVLNRVRELVNNRTTAKNTGAFAEDAVHPDNGKVQACQAR